MARIGLLTFTPFSGTLTLLHQLAAALQRDGDEVIVLSCDGSRPRCLLDIQVEPQRNRLPLCMACVAAQLGVSGSLGLPAVTIGDLVPSRILRQVDTLLAQTPDDALGDVVFEGLPVGLWSQAGLRNDYYGENWAALPDLASRSRGWLAATMTSVLAARAFIARWAPDALVTATGATPSEMAVATVAREQGVRCLSFEFGPQPGRMTLADDGPAALFRIEAAWQRWQAVPLSIAEGRLLDDYLDRRAESGSISDGVFSPRAQGRLDSLRRRLQLRAGRPTLVAFTSVAGDVAAFDSAGPFPTHRAWIEACVAYAANRPDVDLVLRLHPGEEMVTVTIEREPTWPRDRASEVLAGLAPTLTPNVKVLGAQDPVSSYDLLGVATVALVHISTLGMEATARGVPVVCGAKAHYSGKALTWEAENPRAFATLLDRLIAEPVLVPGAQERVRRYLYTWVFRAGFLAPTRKDLTHSDSAIPEFIPIPMADPSVMNPLCAAIRGERLPASLPPVWRPRDPAPWEGRVGQPVVAPDAVPEVSEWPPHAFAALDGSESLADLAAILGGATMLVRGKLSLPAPLAEVAAAFAVPIVTPAEAVTAWR